MTIDEAQRQVDAWIHTYGVRYFSELTNMAVLTEEVGELADGRQPDGRLCQDLAEEDRPRPHPTHQ